MWYHWQSYYLKSGNGDNWEFLDMMTSKEWKERRMKPWVVFSFKYIQEQIQVKNEGIFKDVKRQSITILLLKSKEQYISMCK